MGYILGGITLPQPKKLKREFVEVSQSNATITGRTTKKIVNRKEVYTLGFEYLTQAIVNSLMSIYQLQQVVSFQITEDNLSVGPIDVLVDLPTRIYPASAKEWRENLSIVLTEVK